MKIGILGPKGRLGSELVEQGCTPVECDITDQEDVTNAINQAGADLYINCAAYTKVDACEDDEEFWEARQVNTWGVHKIIMATRKPIIQISTDYVFSGKGGPYYEDESHWDEDDEPIHEPVNKYGWSKWGGEIIASQLDDCYIVRTTGLWGKGNDFFDSVLKTLRSKKRMLITNELKGNQTYIPHLAEALIKYAEYKEKPKVVHIGSQEVISRYDFALKIAKKFGQDPELIEPCLNLRVPGWKARRPSDAGLNVDFAGIIGLPIYTIDAGLEAYASKHNNSVL